MQIVTVFFKDGTEVSYSGVIGFQAGNSAIDISFYTNEALMIPLEYIQSVKRKGLTDEEVLSGDDKEFAAWYQKQLDAYNKKQQKSPD